MKIFRGLSDITRCRTNRKRQWYLPRFLTESQEGDVKYMT